MRKKYSEYVGNDIGTVGALDYRAQLIILLPAEVISCRQSDYHTRSDYPLWMRVPWRHFSGVLHGPNCKLLL